MINPTVLPCSERVSTPNGRMYRVYDEHYPEGIVYASVTNVIGVLPKPALKYWTAREERDLLVEMAWRLHRDARKKDEALTEQLFKSSLRANVKEHIEKHTDNGKGRWAHQVTLGKAQNIGTMAHTLIEWWFRWDGKVPDAEAWVSTRLEVFPDAKHIKQAWEQSPEPVRHAVRGWLEWKDATHFKPVHVERYIWSHKLKVAGAVDLFAGELEWGGVRRKAVADWKTSAAVYDSHRLQVAIYRQCFKEMGEADDDTIGYVLRLATGKGGKYAKPFEPHPVTPDECDQLVDDFFPALTDIWQASRKHGMDTAS